MHGRELTKRMPRTSPNSRTSRRTPPHAAGRRHKADSVLDHLGQKIVTGVYAPGDRLPTEAQLGLQLGVSRPSLREGMKVLAVKGLVESRTRRGTRVRQRRDWDLLDLDVLQWMATAPPDPELLISLLEVRAIIEPAAARMAAQRATAAQIVAIEQAYHAMAASLPHDVEACCRHDLELHEAIIDATGNILLRRLTGAIRTTLLSFFRLSANARESYENSLKEHWAVAAAIRKRAPAEAERAMRLLLAGTARDTAPVFAGTGLKTARAARKKTKQPTKENREERNDPENSAT